MKVSWSHREDNTYLCGTIQWGNKGIMSPSQHHTSGFYSITVMYHLATPECLLTCHLETSAQDFVSLSFHSDM